MAAAHRAHDTLATHELDRRMEHSNIMVAVRIRPGLHGAAAKHVEGVQNPIDCLATTGTSGIHFESGTHKKDFLFDAVLGKDCTQQHLYKFTAKRVLKKVLGGYNGTCFAYGQTGSGKTYTMEGNADRPGIIPLVCSDMFDYLSEHCSGPGSSYSVEVQYLEMYMEELMDLLRDGDDDRRDSCKGIRIHEDPVHGVHVTGATLLSVGSTDDILRVLQAGSRQRHRASTKMNDVSSRSHAIFTLVIHQHGADGHSSEERGEGKGGDGGGVKLAMASRFHLVDLAGSERSDAAGTSGKQLKEGSSINSSLTQLGVVIHALTEHGGQHGSKGGAGGKGAKGGHRAGWKPKHIPYRNSKLTRLLQDSLGGNAFTVMICTVSSAAQYDSETISSLRFAERVKMVRNVARKNVTSLNGADQSAEISRLATENETLRGLLGEAHQHLTALKAAGGTAGGAGPSGEEAVGQLDDLRRARDEALEMLEGQTVQIKSLTEERDELQASVFDLASMGVEAAAEGGVDGGNGENGESTSEMRKQLDAAEQAAQTLSNKVEQLGKAHLQGEARLKMSKKTMLLERQKSQGTAAALLAVREELRVVRAQAKKELEAERRKVSVSEVAQRVAEEEVDAEASELRVAAAARGEMENEKETIAQTHANELEQLRAIHQQEVADAQAKLDEATRAFTQREGALNETLEESHRARVATEAASAHSENIQHELARARDETAQVVTSLARANEAAANAATVARDEMQVRMKSIAALEGRLGDMEQARAVERSEVVLMEASQASMERRLRDEEVVRTDLLASLQQEHGVKVAVLESKLEVAQVAAAKGDSEGKEKFKRWCEAKESRDTELRQEGEMKASHAHREKVAELEHALATARRDVDAANDQLSRVGRNLESAGVVATTRVQTAEIATTEARRVADEMKVVVAEMKEETRIVSARAAELEHDLAKAQRGESSQLRLAEDEARRSKDDANAVMARLGSARDEAKAAEARALRLGRELAEAHAMETQRARELRDALSGAAAANLRVGLLGRDLEKERVTSADRVELATEAATHARDEVHRVKNLLVVSREETESLQARVEEVTLSLDQLKDVANERVRRAVEEEKRQARRSEQVLREALTDARGEASNAKVRLTQMERDCEQLKSMESERVQAVEHAAVLKQQAIRDEMDERLSKATEDSEVAYARASELDARGSHLKRQLDEAQQAVTNRDRQVEHLEQSLAESTASLQRIAAEERTATRLRPPSDTSHAADRVGGVDEDNGSSISGGGGGGSGGGGGTSRQESGGGKWSDGSGKKWFVGASKRGLGAKSDTSGGAAVEGAVEASTPQKSMPEEAMKESGVAGGRPGTSVEGGGQDGRDGREYGGVLSKEPVSPVAPYANHQSASFSELDRSRSLQEDVQENCSKIMDNVSTAWDALDRMQDSQHPSHSSSRVSKHNNNCLRTGGAGPYQTPSHTGRLSVVGNGTRGGVQYTAPPPRSDARPLPTNNANSWDGFYGDARAHARNESRSLMLESSSVRDPMSAPRPFARSQGRRRRLSGSGRRHDDGDDRRRGDNDDRWMSGRSHRSAPRPTQQPYAEYHPAMQHRRSDWHEESDYEGEGEVGRREWSPEMPWSRRRRGVERNAVSVQSDPEGGYPGGGGDLGYATQRGSHVRGGGGSEVMRPQTQLMGDGLSKLEKNGKQISFTFNL